MIQILAKRYALPCMALCLFAANAKQAHGQSLNENSLKANYILRFVDFVRWDRPTNKIARIGVMGEPGLYRELASIAEKKSNETRGFKIVDITSLPENLAGLDMIYIGPGQRDEWPRFVEFSRQGSIITVSSDPGFLEAGGLIEFVTMQNRLRFSLNLPEVDSYNIALSSKLIQLAVIKK